MFQNKSGRWDTSAYAYTCVDTHINAIVYMHIYVCIWLKTHTNLNVDSFRFAPKQKDYFSIGMDSHRQHSYPQMQYGISSREKYNFCGVCVRVCVRECEGRVSVALVNLY